MFSNECGYVDVGAFQVTMATASFCLKHLHLGKGKENSMWPGGDYFQAEKSRGSCRHCDLSFSHHMSPLEWPWAAPALSPCLCHLQVLSTSDSRLVFCLFFSFLLLLEIKLNVIISLFPFFPPMLPFPYPDSVLSQSVRVDFNPPPPLKLKLQPQAQAPKPMFKLSWNTIHCLFFRHLTFKWPSSAGMCHIPVSLVTTQRSPCSWATEALVSHPSSIVPEWGSALLQSLMPTSLCQIPSHHRT